MAERTTLVLGGTGKTGRGVDVAKRTGKKMRATPVRHPCP
jgi:hypothetical protein